MAIYRGSAPQPNKVYRGSTAVDKVYRGGVEVWSDFAPFSASGFIPATVLAQYATTELVELPSLVPDGVYRFTVAAVWRVPNVGGQQITINTSGTLNHTPSPPVAAFTHTGVYGAGSVTIRGFSNASNASERAIDGGTWSIERVG